MTGEPRCLGNCVLIHTRKSRAVASITRDSLESVNPSAEVWEWASTGLAYQS